MTRTARFTYFLSTGKSRPTLRLFHWLFRFFDVNRVSCGSRLELDSTYVRSADTVSRLSILRSKYFYPTSIYLLFILHMTCIIYKKINRLTLLQVIYSAQFALFSRIHLHDGWTFSQRGKRSVRNRFLPKLFFRFLVWRRRFWISHDMCFFS